MSGRRLTPRRSRYLAAALSVFAGALVYFLAVDLFPYLSVNDDEGVYLLQASMLLDGQLFFRPGDLAAAVRPWFFVVDDTVSEPVDVRMYPKYTPVTAAVFAVGRLLGDWNLALGLVAAGNAACVYALGAAAFDRRVGLLSVVVLVSSPLFLINSAVFLPYAPATLFNLVFAVAYVRAVRRDSVGDALLAGAAIGVSFFARQYTAVLFAAPFIAHTLWTLVRASRAGDLRPALVRSLAVALPGLAFVGLTVGYNAVTTGDPLVFPYMAFGPRDGLGFGERALLGYEVQFTPALAVETTRRAMALFLSDWAPAGRLGVLFAVVGLVVAFVDPPELRSPSGFDRGTAPAAVAGPGQDTQSKADTDADADADTGADADVRTARRGLSARALRVVLAGVAASVIVGETYFWGTLNGLRNGLVVLLGPYYHFDLLVPVAVFGAAGIAFVVRRFADRVRTRLSPATARTVLLAALLVSTPIVAVAEAGVLEEPIRENRLRSENLAETYEPFERTEFDRALVYTPDPYGDWQAHPFQYLRNDPGLDGPVVYATDAGPDRDVRVLKATNRTPYRFTYRGGWAGAVRPVESDLRRLRVLRGDRVRATTTVGVPSQATSASVRVETEEGYARYAVANPTRERLRVEWVVGPDGARATNVERAAGPEWVSLPSDASEVDLVVTFVEAGGASITYRQELTVDAPNGDGDAEIEALWPPETRICHLRTECGTEGTWIGPEGDYVAGVSVETSARAVNGSVRRPDAGVHTGPLRSTKTPARGSTGPTQRDERG